MRRLRALLPVLALVPLLAGCPAAPGKAQSMSMHGLKIERIEPDHRVVLSDGLVIEGDAKLTDALAAGPDAIRQIVVLERFPPAYVVTFADGETRQYRSRRTGS